MGIRKLLLTLGLVASLPTLASAQRLPVRTVDGKNYTIETETGGGYRFYVGGTEVLELDGSGLTWGTNVSDTAISIATAPSVAGTNAIEIETNNATGEIRFRTGNNDQIFQFQADGDLEVRNGNVILTEAGAAFQGAGDFNITSTTADAADTSEVFIAAGGGTTLGRGSFINLHGNEDTTDPGEFVINAGSEAAVQNAIEVQTNNAAAGIRLKTGANLSVFDFEPDGDLDLEAGSLLVSTVGKGLAIKTGTNAKIGTFVCNQATNVVVANTSVTANSQIFLTAQNATGAVPTGAHVVSKAAGTSFTANCNTSSSTATMAYMIVEATP